MNNIESLFQELGLSNAETQTYLALLKLGEARIGNILKIVTVTPSNVHEALEKLTNKGLISYIKKNKVKVYKPSPTKSLKQIIQKYKEDILRKEKDLDNLLPQLDNIKHEIEIKQDAEIFFEIRGIKSAFQKLLAEKITGEEFIFFYNPSKENIKIVHEFFSKLDQDKEAYKKISTKGIFNQEYRNLFKQRKDSNIIAKFTDSPIPSNINIYNDKVLIIAWSKKPIAFLLKSKEVSQNFKDLFNNLWKNCNV
ncbi:MAG: TrmB family transcriptional regulator [Nanoarchaeota archaeon]